MNLTFNHLSIRGATIDDAGILCKWWNDGSVMAHAGFPNGLGTNEETIKESIQKDTTHSRRLILECHNEAIGEMSYRKIDDGIVEIGIKICETLKQEKGYGTIYLKMLIDYLFNELDFQKIVLDTNLTNKRAQHVYEKIGFKPIRVNLNSWKDQLGVLQTSIDYELTRKDYLVRK